MTTVDDDDVRFSTLTRDAALKPISGMENVKYNPRLKMEFREFKQSVVEGRIRFILDLPTNKAANSTSHW